MDPFADEDQDELLEDSQDKDWSFNVDNSKNKRKPVAGFSSPLTIKWFVSVVGTEYCHTYFWIAKDLAWMQGLRDESIFFGLLALGWSLVILFHALRTVNWHEIWNFIGLFLWLFANFLWMRGEAHDHEYPEELPIAVACSNMSAFILLVALVWLLLYYVVFLPFNLIHSSKASLLEYDDGQLRPRCSVFRNFRQYENLHMLFWIFKDLAWNRQMLSLWILCLLPTLYISADLLVIALTSNSSDYTVDVVHFAVVLLWVFANSVWAFGDFFIEKYDEPLGIWDNSEETLMTARWYAAWILCFDITVVFLMYGLWVTLSLTGRLGHSAEITHKHSMTGLNLSAGNGVLCYEASDKSAAAVNHAHAHTHAYVSGANGTGAVSAVGAVNSAKYKYAGNVVQRNNSNSISSATNCSSPPTVSNGGTGFSLGGVELASIENSSNKIGAAIKP